MLPPVAQDGVLAGGFQPVTILFRAGWKGTWKIRLFSSPKIHDIRELTINQTEIRGGGSINSDLGLEFILVDTFSWGREEGFLP